MRQLAINEVNSVVGSGSYGPTLSDVVSFAAKEAVPVMVGAAVGLTLRNVIGWDNRSVNEIIGYSVLNGLAFVGGFVGAYAYQDPDVLSR